MDRQRIHRLSAFIPIVLSLMAFALVIASVSTGWGKGVRDEGAAAHIFQLLIAGQAPFIVVFLATAERHRMARIAGPVALQVSALALAMLPVAIFKL